VISAQTLLPGSLAS